MDMKGMARDMSLIASHFSCSAMGSGTTLLPEPREKRVRLSIIGHSSNGKTGEDRSLHILLRYEKKNTSEVGQSSNIK